MWTMDNTDGFTQDQLDLINEVLEEMIAETGMEKSNASDMINNAWVDGIETADDLREALKAHKR